MGLGSWHPALTILIKCGGAQARVHPLTGRPPAPNTPSLPSPRRLTGVAQTQPGRVRPFPDPTYPQEEVWGLL